MYLPGLEFTFIFATLHGVHNGIDKQTIEQYVKEMEKIFDKFDFNYLCLDDLWDKYSISFEKIDKIYSEKPSGWWEKIENYALIEKNAEKRNLRLPPKEGAQKHYIMRDLEKQMLEKEFSGYIFNAFSDPKLKCVLPNMPTLFFYLRKGWSTPLGLLLIKKAKKCGKPESNPHQKQR